jgi:hypothetical protein
MVQRKGFPSAIPDNDAIFLAHFESFMEGVDIDAVIYEDRGPDKIYFSVVPSKTIFFDNIISQISEYFTIFGIRVDFSKSMKSSFTIKFSINYG